MNLRKRSIILISLIVLVMAFTVACGNKPVEDNNVPENVVASVNGVNINLEEYTKNFKIIENNYNKSYPSEDIWSREFQEFGGKTFLEIVQGQILDNMVDQEILKQAAVEKKIEVKKEDVDERYKSFEEQVANDEETKKFYAEQGIDEKFVRNQIETNLLLEKYQESVLEELGLNDTDAVLAKLDDYVVQVHAKHILLKDEAKAKEILDKVKAGEDFEKLAKEFSEDPTAESNGGDLSYFGRGAMVPEFEEAAFALTKGDVSDLVKTDFGYHIILSVDKRTLAELKDQVEEAEYIAAKQEAQQSYVQNKLTEYYKAVRDAAEIKKYPENIK